ncbi:TIGR01212 family radical SAM protein [bacterium]|nr:TIGR01212 family radical SAM protein [candidate division CSSED10-310 bacterium]
MADSEPFLTFNRYLQNRFGERVQRVPVHAGMTCPNRDGTLGRDGCIYCENRSFHSFRTSGKSLEDQIRDGMDRAKRRYGARKFLVYFQTFTNTYAPIESLRDLYSTACAFPDVLGLMIGTRPDCLSEEVLDLLTEFDRRTMVWLEIGMQSRHNRTLRLIRRGHDFAATTDAVNRIHSRNLPVAVHLILGLPGETVEDMVETGKAAAELSIDGVKLHHLHAVKGTELERMWRAGQWTPLSETEYIRAAAAVLAQLPAETVVMRLVGECPDDLLVAPKWTWSKHRIRKEIEKELKRGQVCS